MSLSQRCSDYLRIGNNRFRVYDVLRFAMIVQKLRRYDRRLLPRDVMAGVIVGIVMVPTSLAYGYLAGAPLSGLYAAMLPLVVYALLGSSRQMVVTPDASLALLMALSLGPLAGGDAVKFTALYSATAILAGSLCLMGHFLRLGFVADFLSKPVITGFNHGLALTAAIGQLPKLLGIPSPRGGTIETLIAACSQIGHINGISAAVGTGCIAIIIICHRLVPRLPGSVIALILALLLTYYTQLGKHGVAMIGAIPSGLPSFALPWLTLADFTAVLPVALTAALMMFSHSMVIGRGFATRNRYRLDANRELLALGMSNIVSGLTQGQPVAGSGSKTALAEAAGGRSQFVSICAAVVVSLALMFATDLFRFLPAAALNEAAIAEAAGEGGKVDMVFESVGGAFFEAAFDCLGKGGRIAVCGGISLYGGAAAEPTPVKVDPLKMIYTAQRVEGFVCTPWLVGARGEFLKDMHAWLQEGWLKADETVFDGVEAYGEAFASLFNGKHTGKVVIKIPV